MHRRIVMIISGLLLFYFPMFAQEGKIVREVEVKGNRRVSSVLILSRVRTKVGSILSREVLKEDIKRIYTLGYFSDVSVDVSDFQAGVKVSFLVVEKPYISEIRIKGNQMLKEEEIRKAMALSEGDIFLDTILKKDVERIVSLYEKKGFYKVEVTPAHRESEGKVEIQITIKEGPRIKVKEIRISGNKHIPTSQILKVMKTKRAGLFWRGTFGKEVLEEDVKRIIEFYKSKGFIEAEIEEKKVVYDPTGRFLTLTIKIKEGNRYKVKAIEFSGNNLFPSGKLLSVLTMKVNSPYNPLILEKEAQRIEMLYANSGYITTRVWALPQIDKERKEVDIHYEIEEGPKIYVRLIKIKGNVRTKDKVIRREITIKPGEPFQGDKVKRSRERIFNLGYFKEVRVTTKPTSIPNYHDLIFEVEEKKTGFLTFGLGYSSIERTIGYVELQQSNFDINNPPSFIGGGQKIKLSATIGSVREDYYLSFTEPYFRDKPVSIGFDLFSTLREWDEYDERRKGIAIRMGKKLTDDLSFSSRYRYQIVKISNLSPDAGEELKEEEGRNDTSSILGGLTLDTRDNIFDPSQGVLTSGSLEVAGGLLGGNIDFYKLRGSFLRYFPWKEKFVWSTHVEGGYVNNYGLTDRVPIFERFFLGGLGSVRGYPYRGIGPEDEEGNPVGGKVYFLFNLEYKYPITEKVLKGIVFFDAGEVWREPEDIDFNDLKESVGVGIRFNTPIGPVALDYGIPLEKKGGRLHFSFGYIF
ncbi:outer membrane protein assembly factor BamA [Candidatus Calescamantes bacterium]|nr:outer membrane protein assembly factor BamA [Candidatus Calescamantes bacterium]